MKIVAIILTHNEAEHIHECIESVRWADQVVVFDSYSTDQTVELAQKAGATIIQHSFENFSKQRNAALAAVDAEWVLFVDADEHVTESLAQEIQQVIQNPHYLGYDIPRHNYIFGKLTRHTGWYPDYQMRLLKRESAHYDPERQVHEIVILENNAESGVLEHPLIHYNYKNIQQFIAKQKKYARYDAAIWFHEGKHPKLRNFVLQPYREFKRRFFQLHGYKDGWHGFRLSLLMAWNEFNKYWQLRRLWRQANTHPSQSTEI